MVIAKNGITAVLISSPRGRGRGRSDLGPHRRHALVSHSRSEPYVHDSVPCRTARHPVPNSAAASDRTRRSILRAPPAFSTSSINSASSDEVRRWSGREQVWPRPGALSARRTSGTVRRSMAADAAALPSRHPVHVATGSSAPWRIPRLILLMKTIAGCTKNQPSSCGASYAVEW